MESEYTFKVAKASVDVEGNDGGFELQSTANILGDDVQLDFVVGWDAFYAITKIEPALNDEYKGEWYEQPACGYMMGSLGCTPVWRYEGMPNVDLHHAITFVARSGQKFNLAVDPELKFLSDD